MQAMDNKFSAKDIAAAARVSPQAVNKRASKECWPFEETKGLGGTRRLYHFDKLPMDYQAALMRKHYKPVAKPVTTDTGYNRESLWAHYERATSKKKEEAERRCRLLQQVKRLMDNGSSWKDAAHIVAMANNVSAGSLKNWYFGANGRKGAKFYDPADWLAALLPSHTGRTAQAECSEEAWHYYKADFLRLEKPTATACYERLQLAAEENGWDIPSLSTLERRIKSLPITTRTLLREGEHALMRLFPALERTVQQLHALEWINGDGYQHNVFVKWPDGTIGRPKTWFWQDVYSRKIIAWRTDETENTDTIRLSFGDVVEKFGIPDHVTIDNTRAAANKWMTGGVPNRYRFKVKEDDPIGIFPMMNIQVHWTSVIAGRGHGQAKPVERAFGVGGMEEYIDKHPALAGAYTGPNPTAKPENYGSTAVPYEEFKKVLREGVEMFNAKTKRKTEICGGVLSFNEAFANSYSKALIRKATHEQRRLWMLTAEAITVSRDGTLTLESGGLTGRGKNRYGADQLLEYRGQKVVVRFDPQALHESVFVYTLDGRFICDAECIQAAGFGDTETGRKANRLRKQKMKAAKEQAQAEQGLSALEAAQLLPSMPTDEPPESNLVRPVFNTRKKAVGSDLPHEDELVQAGNDFVLQLWNQKKETLED